MKHNSAEYTGSDKKTDKKIFKQIFGNLLDPLHHDKETDSALHYTRTFWAYSKHLAIHLYSLYEYGTRKIVFQILYHAHGMGNIFLEEFCEDLNGTIDQGSGYLKEYRLDIGFGDPNGLETAKKELHIILCRIYLHESFDDKVRAADGSKWEDFDIPEYEGYAHV